MDNKNVWQIIIDKLIDNINLSTETNDLIKKTNENYEKIISELNLQLQILKEALNLACIDIYALSTWENSEDEVIEDSIKFYIDKAKEIIEVNNQLKIIEKDKLKDE